MPTKKGWTQKEYDQYKQNRVVYRAVKECMLVPGHLLDDGMLIAYNPEMSVVVFIGRTLDDDEIVYLSSEHIAGLIEDGFIVRNR